MSDKLYLVVTVKIDVAHKAAIKAAMADLVRETHKEKGCKKYIVLEDNNNDDTFIFYEKWESYELWQEHMKSAHLDVYREATKGKILEQVIYELNKSNIFN